MCANVTSRLRLLTRLPPALPTCARATTPHVAPTPPQFVLEELQELSDSGVYRSLSLGRIHSAASQRGIFHDNIFLDLSLTSPHLNGGAAESRHEVMVMRALEDGVLSFAIDEFPDMDEDAIEAFWIEKVEAHRRFREESFAAIEAEYRQAQQQTAGAAAAEGPSAGDGEL